MDRFKDLGNGSFRIAPGMYAVVAQDWSGSMPNPNVDAGRHDELAPPAVEEPALSTCSGMETLLLPVGRDSAGCTGRSIAIGSSTLVAFELVAIIALDHVQRRSYPYASHIDQVAILRVENEGTVTTEPDGYRLEGFGDVDTIDAETPGAFLIEGEMFDMAHPETADAFGYGSDAFNAALDEHGFPCDVAKLRSVLAGRREADAVMLINRLPKVDFAIAYYAPVQP